MGNAISITGNRRNNRTGGVKTEHGKTIVRHNARHHGILAELKTKYAGKDWTIHSRIAGRVAFRKRKVEKFNGRSELATFVSVVEVQALDHERAPLSGSSRMVVA